MVFGGIQRQTRLREPANTGKLREASEAEAEEQKEEDMRQQTEGGKDKPADEDETQSYGVSGWCRWRGSNPHTLASTRF